MSLNLLTLLILTILLGFVGVVCTADTGKVYYNGYAFDPDLVPSGMVPYEDGWSHGSLFSAPNWLLKQIDQNLMSTVLDRGVTPSPTPTITPDQTDDYISTGYAALDGGNYRGAYSAFQKATELDPTNPEAWYGLGITLERQNRYLSALEAYQQAITSAEGAASNWASYAGLGRVFYNLNRFPEAVNALETALTQYENAGVSHPDEQDEITRLLEELNQKNTIQYPVTMSAYIPPVVSGV